MSQPSLNHLLIPFQAAAGTVRHHGMPILDAYWFYQNGVDMVQILEPLTGRRDAEQVDAELGEGMAPFRIVTYYVSLSCFL